MKNGMVTHKNRLLKAMSACVENGRRLHQDAEWLATDRSATVVSLCILAQEEKTGTVSHDNELSPGDDEIKKTSVSSVTSVAKSNFMAVKKLDKNLEIWW